MDSHAAVLGKTMRCGWVKKLDKRDAGISVVSTVSREVLP
jgi:hypothetical protein